MAMFDLDNTLIDRAAAFRTWASRFCAARNLPEGAVERLVGFDRDGYRSREAVFADVRKHFALADSVDNLVAAYRVEYPLSYRRDETVLASLGALRDDGWRIAIVTNGPPSQQTKVSVTGLAECVDACCVSEVVGVAKPNRAIFEATAGLAGCELEGWMVGDNPEADIGGGRSAGLQTIWIDRGRSWNEYGFQPTYICNSITQAVNKILETS